MSASAGPCGKQVLVEMRRAFVREGCSELLSRQNDDPWDALGERALVPLARKLLRIVPHVLHSKLERLAAQGEMFVDSWISRLTKETLRLKSTV